MAVREGFVVGRLKRRGEEEEVGVKGSLRDIVGGGGRRGGGRGGNLLLLRRRRRRQLRHSGNDVEDRANLLRCLRSGLGLGRGSVLGL